jgi:ABC-type Zn2+ transport system substrate-binding protein/surface adhesin
MKLLFKEDENRSNNEEDEDDDDEQKEKNEEKTSENINEKNHHEQMDLDKDIEQIYSIQLSDIPLTPFTCQELTRLYLSKEKDENNQMILEKLATCETKDLTISEQVSLDIKKKG